MAPTLSIVTICRNDRPGLERTLASIRAQTWRDFEVELVDGASTDGTADFVRALAEPWLHATSERDQGIFDAQNKGWARARGRYCLFLNAGDALAGPEALARLFEARPTEDLVLCDLLREWPTHTRLLRAPDRITLAKLVTGAVMHPSTLIKRELLERVGPYDATLRIAADHDFFFRAIVGAKVSQRHVPIALSVFAMGGVSSHPAHEARKEQERALILRRHVAPEELARIEAEAARGERRLGRRLRALFRPIGRALRTASRRVRGLPPEF
jgi:glycosyltransferase involved in cell wall biosynthesis